jgi:hypothetical protein
VKAENQSSEANITYTANSAQYRKTLNASVRDSWVKETEPLNLDRDGRKLWRLSKVLNDEDCRSQETAIHVNGNIANGKDAANIFVDILAKVIQINVPPERERKCLQEQSDKRCSNCSRGAYFKQPDNEEAGNSHPLPQTKKITGPRRFYK